MKKALLVLILAGGTIFAANAGDLIVEYPWGSGYYYGWDYYNTPVYTVSPPAPVYTVPYYPVRYYRPAPPPRYHRPAPPPPRHHRPAPHHGRGPRGGHRR